MTSQYICFPTCSIHATPYLDSPWKCVHGWNAFALLGDSLISEEIETVSPVSFMFKKFP
jgi:hypothetical protein